MPLFRKDLQEKSDPEFSSTAAWIVKKDIYACMIIEYKIRKCKNIYYHIISPLKVQLFIDIEITDGSAIHILNALYGKQCNLISEFKHTYYNMNILKLALKFIVALYKEKGRLLNDIYVGSLYSLRSLYLLTPCEFYCHTTYNPGIVHLNTIYLILYEQSWGEYVFNIPLDCKEQLKLLNKPLDMSIDVIIETFMYSFKSNIKNKMRLCYNRSKTWREFLVHIIKCVGYQILGTELSNLRYRTVLYFIGLHLDGFEIKRNILLKHAHERPTILIFPETNLHISISSIGSEFDDYLITTIDPDNINDVIPISHYIQYYSDYNVK